MATARSITNAAVDVVGAGYYFTVGQCFWAGSTLRAHRRQGRVIPCPVCRRENLEFCCAVPVNRQLGLFDARTLARKAYNLEFLPSGKLTERMKSQEPYATRLLKGSIDYFRCVSCDVYFQNQEMSAEERNAFYEHHYRSGDKFGRPSSYTPGSRFHLWADHLCALTGGASGKKFLDVGCAEGYLVLRMKELGFDAHGIEPSAAMVRYGVEELGLPLKQGVYRKDLYPASSFDLINAYHVLEHVDDHRAFVENVAWHLKPGGCALISVPCPEAAMQKLESGTPVTGVSGVLGSGHHLLFSRAYLTSLLAEHGLEVTAHEVLDREADRLPDNKKIGRSGEKWLGMNLLARKA